MKKIFLAIACAAMIGQSAIAQQKEVQYVEDETQGWLLNRFRDNWFITAEGGTNVLFSPDDSQRKWSNRFGENASLWFGKWFSPSFGLRLGGDWIHAKALTMKPGSVGVIPDKPTINGRYQQSIVYMGPALHAMVDLTNLLGGYSPTRVYSLVAYAGTGLYWTLARNYRADGTKSGWVNRHDAIISAQAGIFNNFHLSKRIDLGLDIRVLALDSNDDYGNSGWNRTEFDVQANLALTYKIGKSTWNHPMIPICPEPENCDPLRSQLAAANARIADLEQQLEACLARPTEIVEVKEEVAGPIATIYFPCNVSKLTREDVRVINAVAEVMKAEPETNFVVTGWADNYTGNDVINTRLRNERADAVKRQLVKAGVNASQVSATINPGNLVDLGEKYVALDRAATITVAE